MIFNWATLIPVADGRNEIVTAQFVPCVKLLPQVVVFRKSAAFRPVTLIEFSPSLALPGLLIVSVLGWLVVPTFCDGKVKLAADRAITGLFGICKSRDHCKVQLPVSV